MLEGFDDISNEISRFVSLLKLLHDAVFGDAVYQTDKKREIFLRRPEQLRDEGDIRLIRSYILATIRKYTENLSFLTYLNL